MAEVFLASLQGAAGFDRDVVVKKIHPRWADNADVLSLFKDEARLGSRLNHPNIVQVLDYGRSNGSTYLVMEWVEGYNAADVIAAAEDALEPMSCSIAVTLVSEIARALEHIHTATDDFGGNMGIVHRDLNPANILVSFSGEVKLTDFGVAAGGHRELKTEHGILRGTFPYMSPEQTRCRPLDGRSDLFSLGICLYEMLTGRHPFADEEDYLTIERIQDEEPPRPSLLRDGIDPALDAIVMRMLAKDPADRHDTARSAKADLDAWLRNMHPTHEGTSALIRLMLRLFPRGMSAGEDVSPLEIDLGPTHPGREQPLLDVSALERNRPNKPSPLVDRRSMPQAAVTPDVRDSSVVRLDALLDSDDGGDVRRGYERDQATYRTPNPEPQFGYHPDVRVSSQPSIEVPRPDSLLDAFQAPAHRPRREPAFEPQPAPPLEEDIQLGEALPPWDRAKLLAEIRSQQVLTARGDDPSVISSQTDAVTKPPGRARSLLPWIALSFALSLLFLFAFLSSQ